MKHKLCLGKASVIEYRDITCSKCGKEIMIGFDGFPICIECSQKLKICRICGKEVKE